MGREVKSSFALPASARGLAPSRQEWMVWAKTKTKVPTFRVPGRVVEFFVTKAPVKLGSQGQTRFTVVLYWVKQMNFSYTSEPAGF